MKQYSPGHKDRRSQSMMLPKVYICMLNRNGCEHLRYSIPSVLETDYENFELCVVDNASSDGSYKFIKSTFPSVRVIRLRRNKGCAGGRNVGIRDGIERGAEWIVLIDNDIIVDRRWIRSAIKVSETDDNIGVIGFKVIGELRKAQRVEFERARERCSGTAVEETDRVIGCAQMIRGKVFEDVGLIDEIYFIYAEEDDFELRVQLAGYRMVKVDVPIWHYCEGWGRDVPLKSAYLQMRNNLRFQIKNKRASVVEIARWTYWRLRFACSKGIKVDREHAVQRRMRPTEHRIVNASLLFGALLWNLFHYPETWRAGAVDLRRAREARERRMKEGLIQTS